MTETHDTTALRLAACTFVAEAFEELADLNVIPPSVYGRFLAVGRDYEGSNVMGLSSYRALEVILEGAHKERFADPIGRRHSHFASTYILSFLEACISRCAEDGVFDAETDAVHCSVDELLAVLEYSIYEVACCRHVCHLTTESGQEIQVGDVVVAAEPPGFGGIARRIHEEIPGAPRAWNGEDPRPYDPPHSLLIIRGTVDGRSGYEVHEDLSRQLDHFILVARLLTAGTVQKTYEICGPTTLVSGMNPVMRTFGKGSFDLLVRRTVRLSSDHGQAFSALSKLITSAEVPSEGMVTTSFGIAFSRFSGAYSAVWFENLVDLATALEAILIGDDKETEGLTLRLRSRAAALLATVDDPARAIFDDVGKLYGLRSKIVHGGQIKEAELRRTIDRISTVPEGSAQRRLGAALGHAVDRMRDLVRRAILARLCLAAKPDSLWPFIGQTPVDAILADDNQREIWRDHWHTALDTLGVGFAGERARSAADFLSQDDR